MSRVPHLPQILQGPLSARPAAERTPEWVWYFAWDDDGGAFYRPTREGWVRATPSAEPSPWQDALPANGWTPLPGAPFQFRLNRGVVEMRGGVRRAAANGAVEIATLPPGYRPPIEARFPVAVSGGLASVRIAPDGVVALRGPATPGGDANEGVYLDAVRYAAD